LRNRKRSLSSLPGRRRSPSPPSRRRSSFAFLFEEKKEISFSSF
jgi:hypothetical protein